MPPDDAPTHAGGVVYRQAGALREYLLVRARSAVPEWVLPKGHIERGESAEEAAVREVIEEAGVRTRVVAELGTVRIRAKGKEISVRVYLMAAVAEGEAEEERGKEWMSFGEAVKNATHEQTREMLRLAEERMK